MASEQASKIYKIVVDREGITVANLISEFDLDPRDAIEVYDLLLNNGESVEHFFVECPNCAADVIDGESKYISQYLNKDKECEDCKFHFIVTDQEVFRILYKKPEFVKKKVS